MPKQYLITGNPIWNNKMFIVCVKVCLFELVFFGIPVDSHRALTPRCAKTKSQQLQVLAKTQWKKKKHSNYDFFLALIRIQKLLE